MPPRPSGPQRGLFDNPVRVFSLEELTDTVRMLERQRPGRTVDELTSAVFTELAMKRTQRAADLVAEAIRIARPGSHAPRSPVPAGRPAHPRLGNGRPATASRSAPTAPSPNRPSRHTTRHIPTAHTDHTRSSHNPLSQRAQTGNSSTYPV